MSTDLTKLNFLSTLNYMKRDLEGSAVLTLPSMGDSVSQVITHNLGYIPIFVISLDPSDDGTIYPTEKVSAYTETSLDLAFPPYPMMSGEMTTTTLTITLFNSTSPTATGTRTVYWVIYKDYGDV